jgi:hypothetical protein
MNIRKLLKILSGQKTVLVVSGALHKRLRKEISARKYISLFFDAVGRASFHHSKAKTSILLAMHEPNTDYSQVQIFAWQSAQNILFIDSNGAVSGKVMGTEKLAEISHLFSKGREDIYWKNVKTFSEKYEKHLVITE